MDFYGIFTQQIDRHFVRLKKENVFYKRVFDGSITILEFSKFLKNVSFLTAHTPHHLNLAKRISLQHDHRNLAKFFAKKMGEEVGHDAWGESDLKGIKERFRLPDSILGVTREMQIFVNANQTMIENDPFGYFIYVLYAEYFTVLAGPPCLAAIEKSCQVPMSLMSIIGKHAELDKDHVQDWALDAQSVGLKGDHLAKYQDILQDIMLRYEIFCETLSDKHEQVA